MCGIAGKYNFNNEVVDSSYIKRITDEISHRGPDGEGFYINGNIGLGHRRLSIIDLSPRGRQPMSTVNGRYTIIFNGEIYNYEELRKELLEDDYKFVSETDTEVVLYLYVKYGKKLLKKLRGMFAFCIYDKEKNEFFLARDRYGIKPLYYYYDENKFLFCSEIKGILVDKTIKRIANDKAIYDFLSYNRTDHLEETCFKCIYNLRPGHYLIVNNKGIKKESWYKFYSNKEKFSEETSLKIFKDTLKETIKLHMIADVEVGSCLSGGIDSSSIVALSSRLVKNKENFKTVSAVYKLNWKKDESKYIDDVTEYTNTRNIKVKPKYLDLLKEIEEIIYHQEEPFKSSSIFASWKVMETAKENGIKVLLDGQGADEILGYDYMAAFYFYELFSSFRIYTFLKEFYFFMKKQKFGRVFTFSLFSFLFLPKYLRNKFLQGKNNWLNQDYFKENKINNIMFTEFFSAKSLNESVKKHFEYKINHLLRFEDKNSMAFSIESRVPFLDHVLVEDSLRIPSNLKIRKGELKFILKETMKGLLPESVLTRNDKIGFETPEDMWFKKKEVKNMFKDIFSSEDFNKRKYYNHTILKEFFNKMTEGSSKYNEVLWKTICLEYWFKVFDVKNYNNVKK